MQLDEVRHRHYCISPQIYSKAHTRVQNASNSGTPVDVKNIGVTIKEKCFTNYQRKREPLNRNWSKMLFQLTFCSNRDWRVSPISQLRLWGRERPLKSYTRIGEDGKREERRVMF